MGISMTGIDLWNIMGPTWSLGSQYLPTFRCHGSQHGREIPRAGESGGSMPCLITVFSVKSSPNSWPPELLGSATGVSQVVRIDPGDEFCGRDNPSHHGDSRNKNRAMTQQV